MAHKDYRVLERNAASTYRVYRENGKQRAEKVRQAGRELARLRTAGWVSDVSSWSQFLDFIVNEVVTAQNNHFGRKLRKRHFAIKLVNTAYTEDSDGKKIFYFDAVDRGRSSVVPKNGKSLAFVGREPFVQYPRSVRATTAHNITTKAVAEIQQNFPKRLEIALRRWVRSLGKDASVFQGRAQRGVALDQIEFAGRKTFEVRVQDAPAGPIRDALIQESRDKKSKGFSGRIFRGADQKFNVVAQVKRVKIANRVATEVPLVIVGSDQIPATDPRALEQYAEGVKFEYIERFESIFAHKAELSAKKASLLVKRAERFAQAAAKREADRIMSGAKTAQSREQSIFSNARTIGRLSQHQSKALEGSFRQLISGETEGGSFLDQVEKFFKDKTTGDRRKRFNAARKEIFEAMIALGSADAVMAIFLPTVKDQVRLFKKHTPLRSQYKLTIAGILPPDANEDEALLRNSYKLVTDAQFKKLAEGNGE